MIYLSEDDNWELERLLSERKRLGKRKRETAPRGALSSYVTGAHDGDYLDACNSLSSTDAEITKLMSPKIIRLKGKGNTWKSIADILGINVRLLKIIRDNRFFGKK